MIDQIFRRAQLPAKPLWYVARCIYLFNFKRSVDTYPLRNGALSDNIEHWLQLVRKWGRREKAIFAHCFQKELFGFFSFAFRRVFCFSWLTSILLPPSKNVCALPAFYSWFAPAFAWEIISQCRVYRRHPMGWEGCRKGRTSPKEMGCPIPLLG